MDGQASADKPNQVGMIADLIQEWIPTGLENGVSRPMATAIARDISCALDLENRITAKPKGPSASRFG